MWRSQGQSSCIATRLWNSQTLPISFWMLLLLPCRLTEEPRIDSNTKIDQGKILCSWGFNCRPAAFGFLVFLKPPERLYHDEYGQRKQLRPNHHIYCSIYEYALPVIDKTEKAVPEVWPPRRETRFWEYCHVDGRESRSILWDGSRVRYQNETETGGHSQPLSHLAFPPIAGLFQGKRDSFSHGKNVSSIRRMPGTYN